MKKNISILVLSFCITIMATLTVTSAYAQVTAYGEGNTTQTSPAPTAPQQQDTPAQSGATIHFDEPTASGTEQGEPRPSTGSIAPDNTPSSAERQPSLFHQRANQPQQNQSGIITITPNTALKSAPQAIPTEEEEEANSLTGRSSHATKALLQYKEQEEATPPTRTGAPQLRPLQ